MLSEWEWDHGAVVSGGAQWTLSGEDDSCNNNNNRIKTYKKNNNNRIKRGDSVIVKDN